MRIKEFDTALSTAIFEAKGIIKKDSNWNSDRLCINYISSVPDTSGILVFTFKNWPANDSDRRIIGFQVAINRDLVMRSLFKPQLESIKTVNKEHMINDIDCFIQTYLKSKQAAMVILKCSEDELQIDANNIVFNYNDDRSYVKEVVFKYYTDKRSTLLGYYDNRECAV